MAEITAKSFQLSLVSKLRMMVNFDVRKTRFESKEGGKVVFGKNLSSLDVQEAVERIPWSV